jgi:hypothetical protein
MNSFKEEGISRKTFKEEFQRTKLSKTARRKEGRKIRRKKKRGKGGNSTVIIAAGVANTNTEEHAGRPVRNNHSQAEELQRIEWKAFKGGFQRSQG